jgi:hypothetical protein
MTDEQMLEIAKKIITDLGYSVSVKLQGKRIDYCAKCGEYLHDEMGHMCPPKETPSYGPEHPAEEVFEGLWHCAEYWRDRAEHWQKIAEGYREYIDRTITPPAMFGGSFPDVVYPEKLRPPVLTEDSGQGWFSGRTDRT